MDWDALLDHIEKHLGMLTGRPLYERAVFLVEGFGLARGDGVLDRLQANVAARVGSGSVGWPWALLAECLGRDTQGLDLVPLNEDENSRALRALVREVRVASEQV